MALERVHFYGLSGALFVSSTGLSSFALGEFFWLFALWQWPLIRFVMARGGEALGSLFELFPSLA